jgi:hypothetical protein
MRTITAADSVSPAIQRTREFLFRPFNWGTYLKLGLVAIVTEGSGNSFRSHDRSGQGHGSQGHGLTPHWPIDIPPVLIAESVAALLLALVLVMFVFYLITRLRFAFFHCLIHNSKLIRPGWWLYRDQASRFFWMNVAVGFCFLLLVVLIAIPFIAGFARFFHETQQGGPFDVKLLLSLLLPLLPIILLLALAGFLTDVILRDFMLPHIALEDLTAGEAWSQVWARISTEKRQFFVYALLRLILPAIAMICVFIVLLIPAIALAGSLAGVEFGLHSAFADSTGASALVGVLLQAFFGVLAFGFGLLATICVGGPISTGVREYALIFYGGRYQMLGDILYPPVPRSA